MTLRYSLLGAAALIVLSGCAVGPDYAGPPAVESTAQERFGRGDIAASNAEQPISQWWTQLNDPILDQLITEAFAANRDLASAEASLRASRAVLRERQQDFLPGGNLSGRYQRQGFSDESQVFGAGGIPDRNLYSIGIDAAWEIDLFGRIARNAQAARADAEVAEATRDDLLVSLASEIAATYVALRGAQARLAVANRNAANQEGSFKLTDVLLRGGRGTLLDVERARAQLETTLATIPPLQAEVDASIHRLGVLTGRGPNDLRDRLEQPEAIPQLPAVIAVGDPADLLRRRPDIRIAERSLAAATARIGVATADLFPTLSLTGSGALESNVAGNLLQSSAFAFLAGPQLVWNLLDWTRIRARIAAADARADALSANYESTVLHALQETETALSRYGNERVRLERLVQAQQSSEQAARLARLRYQNGVDNFLVVLDAERVALDSEDKLVVSQIEVNLQLIAIYKALGGGWQNVQGDGKNAAP